MGLGWFGILTSVLGGNTQSFCQIAQTEEERGIVGLEICQQSNVTNGIGILITSDKKDTKETLGMEEAIEIYEQIK